MQKRSRLRSNSRTNALRRVNGRIHLAQWTTNNAHLRIKHSANAFNQKDERKATASARKATASAHWLSSSEYIIVIYPSSKTTVHCIHRKQLSSNCLLSTWIKMLPSWATQLEEYQPKTPKLLQNSPSCIKSNYLRCFGL